MTRLLAMLLLVVPLAACDALSAATGAALPYDSSADFFPTWTRTSHAVGTFSLRTQTGARFTNADLAGRVHIASFVYTRCSSLCPTLVANLKRVAARVSDDRVVIVSYSVTPDLDTPAVLAAFGREHGIDPLRWKLLTGDKDQIYTLARSSYFATDERLRATLDQQGAILHTEKLVLVDADGHLRGVYNGTQPFDLDHLVEDANALAGTRATRD